MNTIKEELEYIAQKNGGTINPADVIEFAKDESTKLHSSFIWDDSKAAHQWRLFQARQIISCQVTYIDNGKKTVECQAFYSLEQDRNGTGYRSVNDIMVDDDFRDALLEQAKKELQRIKGKYSMLTKLADIFAEIDKL